MNWDEKADEAAIRHYSDWCPTGTLKTHRRGARWQRDNLRTPEAVERVAGLFSGWIGCPECAYRSGSICDRCKDFAEWAITALLGEEA